MSKSKSAPEAPKAPKEVSIIQIPTEAKKAVVRVKKSNSGTSAIHRIIG